MEDLPSAPASFDERVHKLEVRLQSVEARERALTKSVTRARWLAVLALLIPIALVLVARSASVRVGSLRASHIEIGDAGGGPKIQLGGAQALAIARDDGSAALTIDAQDTSTILTMKSGGASELLLSNAGHLSSVHLSDGSAGGSIMLSSYADSARLDVKGVEGASAQISVMPLESAIRLNGARFDQAAELIAAPLQAGLALRRLNGDGTQTANLQASQSGAHLDLHDSNATLSARADSNDAVLDLMMKDGGRVGLTTKPVDDGAGSPKPHNP